MSLTNSGESIQLTKRQQNLVLATMCLALVAVVSSVSALNVALNELAVELDASTSAMLWVVNAYTLAMAALLLPVGEVGDRLGRRSVLTAGLIVFALANALSITAGSAGVMIAYRVLAGIGASMIMPATLSTITSVFPPQERGKAVGVWSGFAGAGGILGLLVSAVLIDYASWQWLFVLPIALAGLALALTIAAVPNTRSAARHPIDLVGGLLSALAVGGVVLGIHEGPEIGWVEPVTLVGLVAGVVAGAAFIWWSLRSEHPILDVAIFSNARLAAGSLSLLVLFALMFGMFLVMIQYLQAVLGMSAVRAAAGLLPMALAMMALSPSAPSLAQRYGFRKLLAVGSTFLVAGFVLLATADSDPSYMSVAVGLLLLGIGMGFAMSPATTAITESLPADKQGVASALNDTVREFGSALGVALIGSILAAGYSSSISSTTDGLPDNVAEPVGEGIGQAMGVAAGMGPEGADIAETARAAFLDGWGTSMTIAAVAAAAGGLIIWAIAGREKPSQTSPAAEPELTPV